MKKSAQNEINVRPKRSAACKVQTYSMLQSGYYNEQRDLKRALKCSLIEAAQKNKTDISIKKRSIDNLSIKNSLNNKKIDQIIKIKDENKQDKIDNKSNNDIVIKKFTAHRKFAQNCLPFKNNNLPLIDFKESTKLSTSIYNKQPPSPPLIENEIFTNTKLTTDDFLTFLCFREYVTLPFSLDNQLNNELNSFKLEIRKENNIELVNDKEEVKETFKENSKNMKLNTTTKLKQSFNLNLKDENLIKTENKINQQNNKLNGNKITNNKLNHTKLNNHNKLNNKLNQIKIQQSKVNQIKSNKLTKLAKITKAKKDEKIKTINKQTNLNKKKIIQNKNELNQLNSSSDSIKSNKQIKKKDDHKTIIKKELTIKSTNKKSIKSIKKQKIIKKEDQKSKKIMNTRNLRSGKLMFHHYQTKL